MIILERLYDSKGREAGIIWIDKVEFMTKPLITGKTPVQAIKDDITAGTNKTGHAKYRKILEANGIISNSELQTWRSKLSVTELEESSIS